MASHGKFSINASIPQVNEEVKKSSKKNSYGDHSGRKHVKFEDIEINELNKEFSQEDLDELVCSIKEHGLIHELAVIYDAEGKYKLISGERRYRAIGLLSVEERNELFPIGIPVNILSTVGRDDKDQKITIIEANLLARDYTPAERAKYIFELIDLYEEKKKEGKIKSTRQELMEKFGIKGRRAQTYMSANKLVPELKKVIEDGQILVQEAEKFGAFTEQTQVEIAKLISKKGGKKITAEEMEAVKEYEKKNADLQNQIEETKKTLTDKDETIQGLQKLLDEATANGGDVTSAETVEVYKARLAQSEKEKKAAITNLEKMKLEAKQRSERGIEVTTEDLKKAKNVVKLETALDSLFAVQKTISKMQDELKGDKMLLEKYLSQVQVIQSFAEELTK